MTKDVDARQPTVVTNPWERLRSHTAARIALGRAGVSLPTQPQLAFQLAHAQARDAVHLALDGDALAAQLLAIDAVDAFDEVLQLHSAAPDRLTYLQRPDLGRRLSEQSRAQLQARAVSGYDLAFVIGDGLSSRAVGQHAAAFLLEVMRRIAPQGWSIAPLTIVRQARVAVADEVGQLLGAKLVVMLIGERPGLSSPDSMGLYLTWKPSVGLTDAARNCISNVRPAGLSYTEAAYKLHYLMAQAHLRGMSGVALKDETAAEAGVLDVRGNFLLG